MASTLFVPSSASADLAPLLRLRPDRIVVVEVTNPDAYLRGLALSQDEFEAVRKDQQ